MSTLTATPGQPSPLSPGTPTGPRGPWAPWENSIAGDIRLNSETPGKTSTIPAQYAKGGCEKYKGMI